MAQKQYFTMDEYAHYRPQKNTSHYSDLLFLFCFSFMSTAHPSKIIMCLPDNTYKVYSPEEQKPLSRNNSYFDDQESDTIDLSLEAARFNLAKDYVATPTHVVYQGHREQNLFFTYKFWASVGLLFFAHKHSNKISQATLGGIAFLLLLNELRGLQKKIFTFSSQFFS